VVLFQVIALKSPQRDILIDGGQNLNQKTEPKTAYGKPKIIIIFGKYHSDRFFYSFKN